MDTDAVNRVAAEILKAKSSDKVTELEAVMKAKEEECGRHKDETKSLSCALLDPKDGIAVKMATMTAKQESHGEILKEVKDGQTWLFRGIMANLFAIVLSMIGYYVTTHESKDDKKTSARIEMIDSESNIVKTEQKDQLPVVNKPLERLLASPRLK